jgi:NAD(P) transhydrogenase subunit alpha
MVMKIGVPKETYPGEKRVPLVPAGVEKLVQLGATVEIEEGMGVSAGFGDDQYRDVGAGVTSERRSLLASSQIILRLRKPPEEEISLLKEGTIHISFLDPFNEMDLVDLLAKQGVTAISVEMIPRTTKAQKMDALTSQANLAGYVAVILAAERLDQIFPMMTTPSGTIPPARVFIVGAGVAGLQAIATAKRLGARIEAYDTRPVVEEQVRSLGAKFVKIDVGETGETKDGYAKALTEEQLEMQRKAMAKFCAHSDVVVTTAQLFGRKAPVIITEEMVAGMKPGSVIVDLAAESGGNVAGTRANEEVEVAGVRILGLANLPGRVAVNASQMYSSNLIGMVSEFWDKENNVFDLDFEDEIISGCVVTHQGKIVNEMLLSVLESKKS